MKLIMENVRCFAGRHEVPIAPLTILVGENSSGKSTFLAALSVVSDRFGFPLRPEFNRAPYHLGNFDTISTNKGGKQGQSGGFTLGLVGAATSVESAVKLCATYREASGQAAIARAVVESEAGQIDLSFGDGTGEGEVQLVFRVAGRELYHQYRAEAIEEWASSFNFTRVLRLLMPFTWMGIRTQLEETRTAARDREVLAELDPHWDRCLQLLAEAYPTTPLSMAPIRTRPKPTYDLEDEAFTPEGEHIPFALRRHLGKLSSEGDPERLRSVLARFGEDSGLFRGIDVKELGKRPSDPFQIMVRGSGRPANLPYVGYGVSQVLPVVVQSVLEARSRLLLLQQPEVHLHPRAQAALGSFFIDLVREDEKHFVIETHSDQLVDRIRREVAEGEIPHEDVRILYFEKRGHGTTVFELRLDKMGNILDAPASYRQFFLRETMSLLGRSRK